MGEKHGQRLGAICGALFFCCSIAAFLLSRDGGSPTLFGAAFQALAAVLLCGFVGAVFDRTRHEEASGSTVGGEQMLVSSGQILLTGALLVTALFATACFGFGDRTTDAVLRPSAFATAIASVPTAAFVALTAWSALERGYAVLVGWVGILVALLQLVRFFGISSMENDVMARASAIGPRGAVPALISALFVAWVLVTSIFLYRDSSEA